jgi:hypothetical protein
VDQSIIRHIGEDDEGEDTSISSVKKSTCFGFFFSFFLYSYREVDKAQKRLNPAGTPLKLVQDVKTRWWSTHDLIERILEVRAALEVVFQDEFHHRESQNIPTQLEKLKLMESDFDSLKKVEFVLKPLRKAQKALEGEKYVNLSLLPLVINKVRVQLGLCEGAVDEHTQQDLYQFCVLWWMTSRIAGVKQCVIAMMWLGLPADVK